MRNAEFHPKQVGMQSGHSGAGDAGVAVVQQLTRSVSFTPASVAAAVSAEQSVTVTGAKVGDFVSVSGPATGNATMVGSARVSAANTVALSFINPTAGALTPAAGTFRFLFLRERARG